MDEENILSKFVGWKLTLWMVVMSDENGGTAIKLRIDTNII